MPVRGHDGITRVTARVWFCRALGRDGLTVLTSQGSGGAFPERRRISEAQQKRRVAAQLAEQ